MYFGRLDCFKKQQQISPPRPSGTPPEEGNAYSAFPLLLFSSLGGVLAGRGGKQTKKCPVFKYTGHFKNQSKPIMKKTLLLFYVRFVP